MKKGICLLREATGNKHQLNGKQRMNVIAEHTKPVTPNTEHLIAPVLSVMQ